MATTGRLAFAFAVVLMMGLGAAASGQTGEPTKPPAAPPPATSAPPQTAAPVPAAPAEGAAAPAGAAPAGQVASASPVGGTPVPVSIRLRNLEQRVEALKEQTWRVKARVSMLKEAVLGGGIGARATIAHENKMGGSFRLARVIYALDGQQIFARIDEDTSKLNDLKQIEIFSGPIAPGNHTISVVLEYRGQGYGVFAYLKQYKFTVKSSHTFTATEGKETHITVVGYEKGGITAQLKDRPAVEFKVNVATEQPAAAAPAPATSAK